MVDMASKALQAKEKAEVTTPAEQTRPGYFSRRQLTSLKRITKLPCWPICRV